MAVTTFKFWYYVNILRISLEIFINNVHKNRALWTTSPIHEKLIITERKNERIWRHTNEFAALFLQTLETYFPLKTDVHVNYMYKSYLTSLRTQSMPIIKTNLLIVYVEIIADYCENHTKHKYNAKAKCSVPRCCSTRHTILLAGFKSQVKKPSICHLF